MTSLQPNGDSGMAEVNPPYEPRLAHSGDRVSVRLSDGSIWTGILGQPAVDPMRRAHNTMQQMAKACEKITKPSLWQQFRRWLR
ncbi:hypothetical protein PROPHIGD91-3_23 [Mycobacterium phage prophi91-3]|uniref:hypothetical protein n=1 Tax=Mycobacteroides abscessus TaxID=36809 RepID=UPI0019CFA21F|nr:hypothetical protein [Mycobacteroides abscessus]QSM88777.1 hypothetical protein I3U44_24075 [Mycobacteroides abscessus subsp. bolletii]QST90026.1 hypothetical protein PROPHIGD91-3_23 [Mycobacterium phage prophi91-3]